MGEQTLQVRRAIVQKSLQALQTVLVLARVQIVEYENEGAGMVRKCTDQSQNQRDILFVFRTCAPIGKIRTQLGQCPQARANERSGDTFFGQALAVHPYPGGARRRLARGPGSKQMAFTAAGGPM
nr:hypothetical protein [Candidimonas nitroreducens]